MSAITVGDKVIHYEVLGRGRQVILVHGWVGSWRYWIPTMQQLQAKYRVYALDLFGFGDSSKNPEHFTLEHQIMLLADFMRELGIPKTAFIGHGLGALVVAEYTRRFPETVARLMLVSAPLFDPGDLERRIPAGRKALTPAPPAAKPAPNATPPAPPVSVFPDAPTLMSASTAMRAALVEAARAAGTPAAPPPQPGDLTIDRSALVQSPNHNPLSGVLTDLETLLGKAYRRSEPEYAKLHVDIVKTDPRVLPASVAAFDAGRMLDSLRLMPMPAVVIHGMDDPIMPRPEDVIWSYVTVDKENLLLPIPLPNIRHFPMLEYDRFGKLATDFLDAPDISRLEIKERWRRRTR